MPRRRRRRGARARRGTSLTCAARAPAGRAAPRAKRRMVSYPKRRSGPPGVGLVPSCGEPTRSPVPKRVTLERAETSLGAIELFTFERHRHAFPRHAHEVLTLGVFGAGNGTIRVRGATHRAAPGTLLALAPNEVHSAEPLAARAGRIARSVLRPHCSRMRSTARCGFSFDQPVISDAALAHEVGAIHGTLTRGAATLETEVRVVELLRRAVARHAAQPIAWVPQRSPGA